MPTKFEMAEGDICLQGAIIDVDDKTGNIYISDAIDYSQKGKIYIFTSRGILLNSFNAGIIPGGFYFY